MKLPVQYRAVGDSDWLRSQTENVSRTGVLFTSGKKLEEGTRIEVVLELLKAPGSQSPPEVLCTGQVVRITPDESGELTVIAVNIADYRFEQMSRPAKA